MRAADEYSDLAEYALSHHERWDGKGYPNGLKENEIPLFARVINLCDSYEAMTSARSYKKTLTKQEAIEEITNCSGTQFDPELAKIFIQYISKEKNS